MAEIRLQPGELERIKTHYQLDDDGSVDFESEFSLHRCAIAVPALVGEIEHLRERLAVVEKFAAERAEAITAINNCHPDNYPDYWRWQGHAESRRQLSERLGLPVAWPEKEGQK